MEDKAAFRKNALKMRSSLFSSAAEKEQADRQISEHFTALPVLKDIRTVLCYVSYRAETDTAGIIEKLLSDNYTVAVPRCRAHGQMDFFRIRSLSELKPSSLGIPEPEFREENRVTVFTDTLCVVPGTAFDRKGNRTGYGGGYYDRFLAAEKNIITAGLCYHSLLFDEVPSEPHDECVDYIITEKGIIKINE